MFASLERELLLRLARGTFESENDLLRGLGLLVEDGLGLSSVSRLLAIVPTLSLCECRGLSCLVLGDLVQSVLAAFAALAECLPGLGYVHHLRGSGMIVMGGEG